MAGDVAEANTPCWGGLEQKHVINIGYQRSWSSEWQNRHIHLSIWSWPCRAKWKIYQAPLFIAPLPTANRCRFVSLQHKPSIPVCEHTVHPAWVCVAAELHPHAAPPRKCLCNYPTSWRQWCQVTLQLLNGALLKAIHSPQCESKNKSRGTFPWDASVACLETIFFIYIGLMHLDEKTK